MRQLGRFLLSRLTAETSHFDVLARSIPKARNCRVYRDKKPANYGGFFSTLGRRTERSGSLVDNVSARLNSLVARAGQEMIEPSRAHPLRAFQVGRVDALRAIGFGVAGRGEQDSKRVFPRGAGGIGVEKPRIELEMTAIIVRQLRAFRWFIKKVRFVHGLAPRCNGPS